MAHHMARQPVKETAYHMLYKASTGTKQAARALQFGLRVQEARQAQGLAPTTARENLEAERAAQQLTLAFQDTAKEIRAVREAVAPDANKPLAAPTSAKLRSLDLRPHRAAARVMRQEAEIQAPLVVLGKIDHGKAAWVVSQRGEQVWEESGRPPLSIARQERFEAHADRLLDQATAAFDVALQAGAMRTAEQRMAVAAKQAIGLIAAGLQDQQTAAARVLARELRVQQDPEKTVRPLGRTDLEPVARRLVAAAVAARQAPEVSGPAMSPTLATGVERATPRQGPRMGA